MSEGPTDDPKLPDAEVVDKTIEDRAVRFVIDQERRFGRDARDTRRVHGAAGDIASGDRAIEVKASRRARATSSSRSPTTAAAWRWPSRTRPSSSGPTGERPMVLEEAVLAAVWAGPAGAPR